MDSKAKQDKVYEFLAAGIPNTPANRDVVAFLSKHLNHKRYKMRVRGQGPRKGKRGERQSIALSKATTFAVYVEDKLAVPQYVSGTMADTLQRTIVEYNKRKDSNDELTQRLSTMEAELVAQKQIASEADLRAIELRDSNATLLQVIAEIDAELKAREGDGMSTIQRVTEMRDQRIYLSQRLAEMEKTLGVEESYRRIAQTKSMQLASEVSRLTAAVQTEEKAKIEAEMAVANLDASLVIERQATVKERERANEAEKRVKQLAHRWNEMQIAIATTGNGHANHGADAARRMIRLLALKLDAVTGPSDEDAKDLCAIARHLIG